MGVASKKVVGHNKKIFMHYHLQVILPPDTEDVEDAIKNILRPFRQSENNAFPFFDYYKLGGRWEDRKDVISTLEESPADDFTAHRVIIAEKNPDGTLSAGYMISKNFWNGCTLVGTCWDGVVWSAIEKYRQNLEEYFSAAHASKNIPHDDWLCVTVDYHA